MNMIICADEAIRRLMNIVADGYHYCEIKMIKKDEHDDEASILDILAVDNGGELRIGKYNINEQDKIYDEIQQVSDDELKEYAHRHHATSPDRDVLMINHVKNKGGKK